MFEYAIKELQGSPDTVLAWLRANGQEGWEAFFIEPLAGGYRLWLKRPLSVVAGGLDRSQR